jgi:hypothetical protein
MHPHHAQTSSGDVVTEVNGLLAGLGILTTALFPFALPGLVLALPLALLVLPLVVGAVAVWILARVFALLRALATALVGNGRHRGAERDQPRTSAQALPR